MKKDGQTRPACKWKRRPDSGNDHGRRVGGIPVQGVEGQPRIEGDIVGSDKLRRDDDNGQRLRRLQRQLREREGELARRTDQLDCLMEVDRAVRRIHRDREAALQAVVDSLPSGFRWPERMAARVEVSGTAVHTSEHSPSPWRLTRALEWGNVQIGMVEVSFVGEPPAWHDAPGTDAAPFSKDEERLMHAVANRLACALYTWEMKGHGLEGHMRRSQKMEAVGRLAGGLAHDFNNLLTVIGSRAQLILDDLQPSSHLREEVTQIRQEVQRASRLTRQLLAFGRTRPGDVTRIDLARTVASLESLLQGIIPSRVELRFDLTRDSAPILADRPKVEQVVLNLALNAADAIPSEGRITFSVDRRRLTPGEARALDGSLEPGWHVQLTVEDTGQGMEPQVMERIFEPFFTTKTEDEGTGLGLSTVDAVVRQAGGGISVESQPGQGTTFQILWPMAGEEEAGAPGDPSSQAVATEGGAEPGPLRPPGSATVLVVDDTPAVLQVARRSLERAGYTVLVADNGSDALELISSDRHPVDVVVSDVVMPRMGGAKLLQRLGELRPDLPVILTSGHSDRELSAEIRGRATAFLEKPFGPRELAQVVRETLEARP